MDYYNTEVAMDPKSLEFALHVDSTYSSLRNQFIIPDKPADSGSGPSIYFCGNSLGLQPKRTKELINEELDVWGSKGVNGHFDHPHNRPWVTIDDRVTASAKVSEVAIMNSLTANLHFLMIPFYRPEGNRFRILMESKSFPSDYFAFESQVKYHGYDPKDAIIQIEPKKGSHTLCTSDILEVIEREGDAVALILLSGVQFYTGQFFDIKTITAAGHAKGCIVGWDLAHAAGNVKLLLHDWDVDFAAWCSYKYLNAGPGGIGGAFIHERHDASSLPMFAGWWGSQPETKFDMDLEFKVIPGAQGYRLSNPCVLAVTALSASLSIFDQTNMDELTRKSKDLTGFLEFLINELLPPGKIQIITPQDPEQRGCQLSLLFLHDGLMSSTFKKLEEFGVMCDARKPDVIRVAPTPLYNTFEEVWEFVTLLSEVLQ